MHGKPFWIAIAIAYILYVKVKSQKWIENNLFQTPLLTVPKDIVETIGSDEWISRTILDSKVHSVVVVL